MPKTGGSQSRPTCSKNRDPISKITIAKRAGGMAQAVERLPTKHKALNSNHSTSKNIAIVIPLLSIKDMIQDPVDA
jgi:hypothetical protein